MKDADYYKKNIKNNLDAEIKEGGRQLELKNPSQMVDSWASSIEGDLDRPLTTGLKKIDKDLKGRLRGTVGAYLGYGGTKKSLLALQGCREGVLTHKNNCTGIYSSMEMAEFQLLSRLLDMSFEEDGSFSSYSYVYENRYEVAYKNKEKSKMEKIRKLLKDQLFNLYGNNLLINSQSKMRVEDYDKLIKQAKKLQNAINEELGQETTVDELVVDGLSMMDGLGTETERYTTNSQELKDLAKFHNIFIPLICHLSKGADKHTRDVQRFVRGSEKILDNVDFVVMLSLCIDEGRSSANAIKYMTDFGFVEFFNKRGTGNTIDIIYEFDKKKLLMIETDVSPELYEVDFSKKTKAF